MAVARERKTCEVCGQSRAISASGKLIAHRRPGPKEYCEGGAPAPVVVAPKKVVEGSNGGAPVEAAQANTAA